MAVEEDEEKVEEQGGSPQYSLLVRSPYTRAEMEVVLRRVLQREGAGEEEAEKAEEEAEGEEEAHRAAATRGLALVQGEGARIRGLGISRAA